jgi:hypothetical protein
LAESEPAALNQACPICGDPNSPVVDGVLFWTLNSFKLPNEKDVKIDSVWSAALLGNVAMRLVVASSGDQLLGVHPNTNAVIASGSQLEGTKINLLVGPSRKRYQVIIAKVSPTFAGEHLWVGQFPGLRVETYDFLYAPEVVSTSNGRPLCSANKYPPGDPPSISAIVFKGELYDPTTKAINFSPSRPGWFNIACVGGAPYKMHMIGYTSVAQARLAAAGTPVPTSEDMRRSMLNAWTMNACGTGTSFTHHGEPITLSESLHALRPDATGYLDPTITTEAVWGPNGALCLNTPRLTEEDKPDQPTILKQIEDECATVGKVLPRCTATGSVLRTLDAWPGGYVLTGNPFEP